MFRSAQTKNKLSRAFTLIEILIVVGILGILAAIALIAINPAEAQKKARDARRLKDLSTLQAGLDQYINDVGALNNTWLVTSTSVIACDGTGWINGWNLCNYLQSLPTDPSNGKTGSAVKGDGTTTSSTFTYRIRYSSQTYKICSYLEAKSNASKLTSDAGNNPDQYEVFTGGQSLDCP